MATMTLTMHARFSHRRMSFVRWVARRWPSWLPARFAAPVFTALLWRILRIEIGGERRYFSPTISWVPDA